MRPGYKPELSGLVHQYGAIIKLQRWDHLLRVYFLVLRAMLAGASLVQVNRHVVEFD